MVWSGGKTTQQLAPRLTILAVPTHQHDARGAAQILVSLCVAVAPEGLRRHKHVKNYHSDGVRLRHLRCADLGPTAGDRSSSKDGSSADGGPSLAPTAPKQSSHQGMSATFCIHT
jgi:hypothetical protein